jgi:hypothetical protein
MATESTTPPDPYRANLALVLRILMFGHDARRQACEFEMRRIKRGLAALTATREATTGARDWSELASSYQAMLRDYMAATTNLWQQGLISAARQQSACGDGMRDAIGRCQSAWADVWQKGTGINPSSMPLQEWLQRFEQTVSGALDGRTTFGQCMKSAMPTAAAHSRAQQGDQHVG